MSESHSTPPAKPAKPTKPEKPYPDYPLWPHPSGRWCRKIRGKWYYFGPWDDPDGALDNYNRQKEDLHSGRKPRADTQALTVKELVNRFRNAKKAAMEEGRLSALTYGDYTTACDEIIAGFGKGRLVSDLRAEDFTTLRKRMARKWGLQRLCKNIQFVRCVFKWGFDSELIDRPVRFGPDFKRPSKKDFRIDRARRGPKLFTAPEIRRLIDGAGPQLRAMLLLGINCAFGNADCGNLPQAALDLDGGWVNYPRVKTGIERRCPLWPETVQALREALESKPAAKKPEHARLVFITRCGDSWHTGTTDGPLSREVGKLLRKLGINGRKGLGYYTLRHTFRTVADQAKDQPAADFIMGHESSHISTAYRETIDDSRLKAVSDHVHGWLYAALVNKKEAGAKQIDVPATGVDSTVPQTV